MADKYEGGYHDVKFTEPPPDSLICPICLLVLNEPHLLSCCGCHMCKKCMDQVKIISQLCPCCREEEYVNILDKSIRGKVLGLKVFCSVKGCDWEGELGDLQKHVETCNYVAYECPHGCGKSYPRHLLQTHQLDECSQRPVTVQLESMQRQFLQKYKKLHTELQKVQQQLVRQEQKHKKDVQELQQQIVKQDKKYAEGMKALQQQLLVLQEPEKDHREQEHSLEERDTGSPEQEEENDLNIAVAHQQVIEAELAGTNLPAPSWLPPWLVPAINIPNGIVPCYFAMRNFSVHKQVGSVWYSPPFYTHPEGYKMEVIVDANSDGTFKNTDVGIQMSVYLTIIPGEHDDKLTWPYTGAMTIDVINWDMNKNHLRSMVGYSSLTALGYGNRAIGKTGNSTWVMASRKNKVQNNDVKYLYLCGDILYLKIALS